MTISILLASALSLLFQAAPPSLPTITGPLRNTFAVAAESVIDNATAVDIKAIDEVFNAQLQQLKTSRDTLTKMASDSREKEIADDANNMVFMLSACHIQAKNGSPTAQCESQFSHARTSIMNAINKHKSGTAWADGPPS